MANQKISAMASATAVANADVLPIVQGGTNKKAARSVLLTAAPGESIALQGVAGSITITVGGTTIIVAPGGQGVQISGPNSAVGVGDDQAFMSTNAGRIRLLQGPGHLVIDMDSARSNILISFSDPSGSFNPNPTDLPAAVQRIAAAVAGLLLGPIP